MINRLAKILLIFAAITGLVCCGGNPTLKITSRPPGAAIILRAKDASKKDMDIVTPCEIQVTPGEYDLILSKLGYQPAHRHLSIKGKTENIDIQLTKFTLSDMIEIPAGPFRMGSSDAEIEKISNDLAHGELSPDAQWFMAERPQHEARVEKFYIDKYEITHAQYEKFVLATGRSIPRHWEGGTYPEGKEDHPVVYVSWEDADAYCTWAGKRLPTETEWEKAARGTDGLIWPWGDTFDVTKCNVESWEGSGSRPVGSYPGGVSPYGVYDMAGNVWEWTNSWYDAYPGSTYTNTEFGQKLRVLRGGSWYHYNSLGPIGARCASRDRQVPQAVSYVAGFRCAIGADELPDSQ